jgi:hypothetical protein
LNAGIPGVGIAGLFFVVCALVMPFYELGRTVVGRSSLERWRVVARNWLLAVAMLGVFVAMGWAVSAVVPKGVKRGLRTAVPMHLSAVAITVLLLVALLVAVQVAVVVRRPGRGRRAEEPRREAQRAL